MTSEPYVYSPGELEQRCGSCIHWQNPWDGYSWNLVAEPDKPQWGICSLIDLPGWERPYDEEAGAAPIPVDVRAFTIDASDCKADLNTRADFGCVLHQPKENL